jgi:hypothetical protein
MEQFLHSSVSFPAAETEIKHSCRVGATLSDSLLFCDTSTQLQIFLLMFPGAFAVYITYSHFDLSTSEVD